MVKHAATLSLLMALVALSGLGQEVSELTAEQQQAAWREFVLSLDWVPAGGTGTMGAQAEIVVPTGYVFTGADGTQKLMEAFGNLLTEQEVGFVAPAGEPGSGDFPWFAVFEFDEVGYVKDDDKAELDADKMMAAMVEGQQAANEERQKRGYDTLDVTGWAMKPRYNETTNNLEWAINLRSGAGTSNVNLNTRLLGREGVMKVTLVCDPAELEATTPHYQEMLRSFRFQEGRRYAEFRAGDKLAKYGLTGLIVGGGAAVLAKTGLLKKIFKPLLIGLVALGAWLKRFFKGGSTG